MIFGCRLENSLRRVQMHLDADLHDRATVLYAASDTVEVVVRRVPLLLVERVPGHPLGSGLRRVAIAMGSNDREDHVLRYGVRTE